MFESLNPGTFRSSVVVPEQLTPSAHRIEADANCQRGPTKIVTSIFHRLMFRSLLSHSRAYRADIDGLRALAVLPVLFFHTGVPGFSGGFVGVDVFYVISGYLITSIIIRDLDLGRFSIASFYERRIRRIFPALFAVVLFTLLAAGILLAPANLFALGKSLIAMTVFSSNIYFRRQGGADGYFANDSSSLPLLHTWSLSVEEQFYVFFPAALILLTRYSGRRRGVLVAVAAAGSFAVGLWQTQHQPLSAFYLLIPRAWELLIGATLALKVVPPLPSRGGRDVIGAAGLGLLIVAVSAFDKTTTFPGALALIPCLGAALIVYSSEQGPSLVGRILSVGPLVFIGVISYSLYLWHWPILVFAKYFRAGPLSNTDIAAVIAWSIVLAFLSFEFVEAPFRRGQSRVGRRQIFQLGLAACAFSAIAGLTIYLSRGFPQRFSEGTRQAIARNSEMLTDYQETCSNWKKEIKSEADIDFCSLGTRSPRTIMFWGDSHVQQLYPLIKRISDQGGLYGQNVIFAVDEGCAPAEHLNRPDPGFHCDSFAQYAMARAEQSDVDVVFIGFAAPPVRVLCPSTNGRCTGSISNEEADRRLLQELSSHIHRLRVLGKRVIVSLPFPLYDKSIPELQVRNAILHSWGSVEVARDRTLPSMRDKIASVAVESGADLFDPRRSLCNAGGCITEVAGVSIYKDFSHLAASQISILEGNMTSVLERVIPSASAATQSRSQDPDLDTEN